MKEQGALDEIAFEQILASAEVFEDFRGQILAGKQKAELRFVQSGIIEESGEHLGRGVIEQSAEVVTRSGARELQFVVELGHATSFPPQAPGSAGQGERRIPRAR